VGGSHRSAGATVSPLSPGRRGFFFVLGFPDAFKAADPSCWGPELTTPRGDCPFREIALLLDPFFLSRASDSPFSFPIEVSTPLPCSMSPVHGPSHLFRSDCLGGSPLCFWMSPTSPRMVSWVLRGIAQPRAPPPQSVPLQPQVPTPHGGNPFKWVVPPLIAGPPEVGPSVFSVATSRQTRGPPSSSTLFFRTMT